LVEQDGADALLRSYYDAVAEARYEESWSLLAPEFQRGKARSFEYYAAFWDENDIQVGRVALVRADTDTAVVHVELYWNGSNDPVLDEFTLRAGPDGQPLITQQRTVG
jgi:hypothetical protein